MPRVAIPSPLLSYTGGRREVEVAGSTVAEVLVSLDARFPGLRFRVVDEQGAIRPHVRVWVGTRLVRSLDERVPDGDDVMLVGSLSGG